MFGDAQFRVEVLVIAHLSNLFLFQFLLFLFRERINFPVCVKEQLKFEKKKTLSAVVFSITKVNKEQTTAKTSSRHHLVK